MAFNLGDIFVTFKAKTEDLQRGVGEVKNLTAQAGSAVNKVSFADFAKNASGNFANVASSIKGVATKLFIVAGASSYGVSRFINLAGSLQTTQQQMTALSGSTEKAQQIMGELYAYVLGKPIEFPTAAKAAQTLMGYGVETKNVISAMKTLSAFSVVNGADMSQLALAYGQVNAKGHLMGQEIIQLTNNFVPVNRVIANHFNVSMQKAQELMEGGKITAKEFNAAMAEFIPQEKIAEQANTFKNRMISLQGSIRAFGLALIGVRVDPKLGLVVEQGGLFDKLSNFLPRISASLSEMKPKFAAAFQWLVDNGETIKAIVAGIAAAFVAAKVGQYASALVYLAARLMFLTGAMSSATAAQWGFNAAADANPVGLIVTAIVAFVAILVALQVRFDWIGKTVRFLMPVFQGLVALFEQFVLPSLRTLVATLIAQLGPALRQIWDSVMRLWNSLNPGLMTAVKVIATVIGALWVAQIWLAINVLNVAIRAVSGVISVVSNLIKWISNLIGWFGNLIGASRNAAGNVLGAFRGLPGAIGSIVSAIAGWFRRLPGMVGSAIGGIAGTIIAPFRNAFGAIARLWNGTVGRLNFKAPDWVPGIGGKGFAMPQLPQLAGGIQNFSGGWAVVGERGPELAYVPKGSTIFSNDKSQRMVGRTTNIYGDINIDSEQDADYFFKRIDRNSVLESRGLSPA